MTYKELQAQLKDYRNNGTELQVKLNAKKEVLEAELKRIQSLDKPLDDSILDYLSCTECYDPPLELGDNPDKAPESDDKETINIAMFVLLLVIGAFVLCTYLSAQATKAIVAVIIIASIGCIKYYKQTSVIPRMTTE